MKETKWQFYTSNEESWEAMLGACREAKESIDLEQFIFVADEIGNKFIEVCAERAEAGVRVRFLWDAAGSFSFFGSSIVSDLKKKNIELVFFKTLFPGFFTMPNYRSWYFRNHRRTLIIDEEIGFTGSICISKRMRNWRDTHLCIEGPVVKDMQRAFETMWNRANGRRMSRAKEHKRSDHEFEYIINNPIPNQRHLYHNTIEAIRNARKYIYITTPYFVPTHRLSRVLRLAAHRGIDVKIIMPEKSDYPIVDMGARTFFHNLLESGVKIYLYRKDMIHNKTMIIDGHWSSIGTLNMDNVSLLYNFEANIITSNSKFAEELSSHFVHDIEDSIEITFPDWKNRFFVEKIANFFIKFFRIFL